MHDFRTLTFTIDQLVQIILLAKYAEPPTNLARAELAVRQQLAAEFQRQKRETNNAP